MLYDSELNARPMDAVEDGVDGDGGERDEEECDPGELAEALCLTNPDEDNLEVLIRGLRLVATFPLLETLLGTLLDRV